MLDLSNHLKVQWNYWSLSYLAYGNMFTFILLMTVGLGNPEKLKHIFYNKTFLAASPNKYIAEVPHRAFLIEEDFAFCVIKL
jgi:hypothetical protein